METITDRELLITIHKELSEAEKDGRVLTIYELGIKNSIEKHLKEK